jgi:hypothetical protein
MRIADLYNDFFALLLSAVTSALDFQSLREALIYARDHVRHQASYEAMRSSVPGLVAGASDQKAAVLLMKADLRWDAPLKLAARPFHRHFVTVDVYLYS